MKQIIKKLETSPLISEVQVPGSKSVTNRALLLSSLCAGDVKVINPLVCDDTTSMISCLKKLGVKIAQEKESWTIQGSVFDHKKKKVTLNAGLSGTTLRFLLPILCITAGEKVLTGDTGLLKRPIGHLVESLKALGADITYLEQEGHAPLLIKQSKLQNKTIEIKGHISSQYLSSILMLLPYTQAKRVKVVSGLVSKPYIDLTLYVMKKFGVTIENKNFKSFLMPKNKTYKITKPFVIDGDVSSACYFAALAVLTGSKLHLKNINSASYHADSQFFDILQQMGNTVIKKPNSIIIHGNSIKPIKINMENCPDQIQTLAVLASFAKGKTLVSGIQTLRVKETDRVFAITSELLKMGIKTKTTKKTLTIYGGNPKSAEIETYGDHRMAMSFALAGVRLPGIIIKDPNVVSKTFPEFWNKLDNLGI